ncbi:MAG: hypothetical protein IT576_07955 [Verrucomicrobiales bacterium]|nr:hypothetical protein [Verrucomicrobiales bacterium]
MRASTFLLTTVVLLAVSLPPAGSAQNAEPPTLSPELTEKLKSEIERLHDVLTEQSKARRGKASEIFNGAAADAKKAVALYLECHKTIDFDREGRSDAEFREWRDGQDARLKEPVFVQGLQLQLRYLGLACEAAETQDLANIFPQLMTHMDNLVKFNELPPQVLTQSINGSIFARAYELENLLSTNKSWESIPMNIAGIYQQTILPYLRKEKPASLMSAWSKRVEQEKKMVAYLESVKHKAVREVDRDKRGREENRIENNLGGLLRKYDSDDFERDTLPNLQWDMMRDKYSFVDPAAASAEMIKFIETNLKHPRVAEWLEELSRLASGIASAQPETPGNAN